MTSYDLIAIGSGPAGQRAAVQAAKLGARVALVESQPWPGGVCINTGTLPSKTLREAILDLGGRRQRALYGVGPAESDVSIHQLFARTQRVIHAEREIIKAQLQRNGIALVPGLARFEGPSEISVTHQGQVRTLSAKTFLIAVGTRPAVPAGLTVDHVAVLTSDDILSLHHIPRQLVIAGAGVVGVEYATMFAALGVSVTLTDVRRTFLDLVDGEVAALFRGLLEASGVRLLLGSEIDRVERADPGPHTVVFKNGDQLAADVVFVSAGRQGATEGLQLERAGLVADARGRLAVNEHYQTSQPHIYAAGDVIGAPQLAATSAEQGRLAACHAFGLAAECVPSLFPFGIYAIPEIAWVGKSEETLRSEGVDFESGIARYKEIARGAILGDGDGILKLLVQRESQEILGVWICGTQATELIHIGQAVMALGGKLDYFLRTVFNYPTLAECYKVAALNGMNKLRAQRKANAAAQTA
ncbi:MAG: Si-specific NAD(P)(+) transhydrogenase [Deltaproteobacteria bacterium]